MNEPLPGLGKMTEWTEELPAQIAAALNAARERGWPPEPRESHVPHAPSHAASSSDPIAAVSRRLIMGMGGSGISGKLGALLLDGQLSAPVTFVGDGTLPSWVDATCELLVVSYSGQTWEAVGAWDEGMRRGARLAAITSGGALLGRAESSQRPYFEVPSGYPPRAALGWMLAPAALWLAQSSDPSAQLATGVESISRMRAAGNESLGADPEELGRAMADRPLYLYASSEAVLPLAQRWRSQLAENAKQMAQVGCFPEVTHNEVEAWADPSGTRRSAREATRPLCLILEPSRSRGERERAIDAMLEEVRQAGGEVRRLTPKGGWSTTLSESESWIDRVLALLWLGDLASLACAEARGVDPLLIPALDRVKAAIRAE